MKLISALVLGLFAQTAVAQNCANDSLFLKGDWGQARFSVEIADDVDERAQGLMHRSEMASTAGMLFVYQRAQSLSFWMRNTLIELDMLFIDSHGVVQHIHHRAQPLDETPIFGGNELTHVLEINGGMASRLGLSVGNVVQHPTFLQAEAAWPC
ncbi:MAG: DUF192 domain-containing protein [Roseobacter sp.]